MPVIKNIKVDEHELLRYLGYRGQDMGCELIKNIHDISGRCQSLSSPRYCYNLFDVEQTENSVHLSGTDIYLEGKDIKRHLDNAEACAVMAVTLGMQVEYELTKLEYQSVTNALIFNAACTALVETAADICEDEIGKAAAVRGLKKNYRYSPGYGDFPLEQQLQLLRLLDTEKRLGITLNSGGLMIPRKSVTAVIGLFRRSEEMADGKLMCQNCSMFDSCELKEGGENCGR